VVNVRPVADHAAAHLLGALSIPLRPAFATWLGSLADPTVPIVIAGSPDQDDEEIVRQALKIGYENLAGEVGAGMDAWPPMVSRSGRRCCSAPPTSRRAVGAGGTLRAAPRRRRNAQVVDSIPTGVSHVPAAHDAFPIREPDGASGGLWHEFVMPDSAYREDSRPRCAAADRGWLRGLSAVPRT
jgi:hypothetical protein